MRGAVIVDHDTGDESKGEGRPDWWDWRFAQGEGLLSVDSSMWIFDEPKPDQDAGDEDDFMNYVPSVHPAIGMRCWVDRSGR